MPPAPATAQPASHAPCHALVEGPNAGDTRRTAQGPPRAPRACDSGRSSCSAAAPALWAVSRPHAAQQLAHIGCGMHTHGHPAAPPAHAASAPGDVRDRCQLPWPLTLLSPMGAWQPAPAACPAPCLHVPRLVMSPGLSCPRASHVPKPLARMQHLTAFPRQVLVSRCHSRTAPVLPLSGTSLPTRAWHMPPTGLGGKEPSGEVAPKRGLPSHPRECPQSRVGQGCCLSLLCSRGRHGAAWEGGAAAEPRCPWRVPAERGESAARE